MNSEQLNFVMDKLGFTGDRRKSAIDIIVNSNTAYSAEKAHDIPKGTASRDAIKCSEKWGELLQDAQAVNDLLISA